MHNTVFCIICSFIMFVDNATGDHIVELNPGIDLVADCML